MREKRQEMSKAKSCKITSTREKRQKMSKVARDEDEDDDDEEQQKEADLERGVEAAGQRKAEVAEVDKGDGASSAASRASTATDRNRARRDRALQCKDVPKPTSKWCSGCLQDLLFSSYAKKKSGFAIFGRAAQCDACSQDEEVELQAAVRYMHASHCESIARVTQPTLRIKLAYAYIVSFLQEPSAGSAGSTGREIERGGKGCDRRGAGREVQAGTAGGRAQGCRKSYG
jgi:hypothetical protein